VGTEDLRTAPPEALANGLRSSFALAAGLLLAAACCVRAAAARTLRQQQAD
jgi:hypothetical protein